MSKLVTMLGVNKAAILAAAFNQATAVDGSEANQGYNINYTMTVQDAQVVLDSLKASAYARTRPNALATEYLQGRFLFLNFTGDMLDPWVFDNQYGFGTFATIVENVRAAQ